MTGGNPQPSSSAADAELIGFSAFRIRENGLLSVLASGPAEGLPPATDGSIQNSFRKPARKNSARFPTRRPGAWPAHKKAGLEQPRDRRAIREFQFREYTDLGIEVKNFVGSNQGRTCPAPPPSKSCGRRSRAFSQPGSMLSIGATAGRSWLQASRKSGRSRMWANSIPWPDTGGMLAKVAKRGALLLVANR